MACKENGFPMSSSSETKSLKPHHIFLCCSSASEIIMSRFCYDPWQSLWPACPCISPKQLPLWFEVVEDTYLGRSCLRSTLTCCLACLWLFLLLSRRLQQHPPSGSTRGILVPIAANKHLLLLFGSKQLRVSTCWQTHTQKKKIYIHPWKDGIYDTASPLMMTEEIELPRNTRLHHHTW